MERLHKRSRIGLLLSILLALSACAAQPHPAAAANRDIPRSHTAQRRVG